MEKSLFIIILLNLLILIATVLPMSKNRHWVVRAMDFPRMQIACLTICLLIYNVVSLDLTSPITWGIIIPLSACLFWQLWWILPYTFLWKKEVKTSTCNDINKQLSILTTNVLKTNRNSGLLIEQINKLSPDILVTLETDQWWEDELAVIEADMPYSVKCPLDNYYGMHVYSKLPFSEEEICFLVEEDIPSIHFSLKLRSNDNIRMHFMHPAPPSPTENTESTERDAELLTLARSIVDSSQPIIVTGDLNDVVWSPTTRMFRKISGLLDPRIGRGVFSTFHVDYSFLRWPLDHLFHSDHFTLLNIKRLPSIGSDHFALFSQLAFTPNVNAKKEGVDANKDEREEAKKMSESNNVSKDDIPTLDKDNQ